MFDFNVLVEMILMIGIILVDKLNGKAKILVDVWESQQCNASFTGSRT